MNQMEQFEAAMKTHCEEAAFRVGGIFNYAIDVPRSEASYTYYMLLGSVKHLQ